jgi:hypothetical protein
MSRFLELDLCTLLKLHWRCALPHSFPVLIRALPNSIHSNENGSNPSTEQDKPVQR